MGCTNIIRFERTGTTNNPDQIEIARQLCDDGLLNEVEITHQMVTFKGYEINHHGIAAYCSHLPDDVDIDEMEREMKQ